MLDTTARRLLMPALDRGAAVLDRPGITPDRVTVAGLLTGLASAGAAAGQLWWVALALWLTSRLLDGLDGPLARRRGSREAGGFLDLVADFTVYGASVVGVAVGVTEGEDAPWWPFLLVLLAYYVNGTALLAFSSAAERTGRRRDDGRTFSFLGGLAEGTETIVVHSLWLAVPSGADEVAVVWAVVTAVSAGQRTLEGYRCLR